MTHRSQPVGRDVGNVLPIVLMFTVVLSVIVGAIASYTSTGLRYGQIVERRADRLAAADGGMRYAIEQLSRIGHHDCPEIDPPDINGAAVTLTCTAVGDPFASAEGYALVLTGAEIPNGCTDDSCALIATSGGPSASSGQDLKKIGGLMYMSRPTFDLQAPLELRDGALQIPMLCPSMPASDRLLYTDGHFGAQCDPTTPAWDAKFFEPTAAPEPTTMNPPSTVNGACRVFHPGYYTAAPDLGASNYFNSGNYVFDGFTFVIDEKVTAGVSIDTTQLLPNVACGDARDDDRSANVANILDAGATFYLKNGARFQVNAHGSFEIVRRKQGKEYVSIHVVDDSLTYTDYVIEQGPGSNKDMAVQGRIWAPQAAIAFEQIAESAVGQLIGGAIVSKIRIDASANTEGFVIEVAPNDITGKLQLDSTAVLDGEVTTIRSIVDYRPTTKFPAPQSWRVIEE